VRVLPWRFFCHASAGWRDKKNLQGKTLKKSMSKFRIYIFVAVIGLHNFCCQNQIEKPAPVKPEVPIEKPAPPVKPEVPKDFSHDLETRVVGRLYTSKKYRGHRLSVFNLNEVDWPLDQEHPKCPALSNLRSNEGIEVNSEVLPFNLRIPYPVSYANLGHFFLLSLIKLNNQMVSSLIPSGAMHELAMRSIKFDNVPVYVALYEAYFESETFNYYTHFWAHDDINIKVNKTIDIATGFFDPVGVDVKGLTEAVGINELKTHGAYVHPIPTRAGLSPNNAKFRIDANLDAVTFWALSVDVDPKSSYLGSAILIWNIAIIHQPPPPIGGTSNRQPRKLRFHRMHKMTAQKIKNNDPSPCIDGFNAKDWLDEFAELSYINNDQREKIIEQLKRLMAKPEGK
jgi:hypothetical protein